MPDPEAYPLVEELPPHPELPDPFQTFEGEPIETPEQWYEVRRPELERLFQHYVYGYLPEPPGVDATLVTERDGALDGAATYREYELAFEGHPDAPTVLLSVFLPADRDGPVPAVLGLNGLGNHAVVADDVVTRRDTWHRRGRAGRGDASDAWAVENTLARGYGLATFDVNEVDPDRDGTSDGVRPHFEHPAGEDARWGRLAGTGWGTLAAWAWGASRCLDALETDDDVDDERVAVVGMSRRGKASLLAGALDERFALVVPHMSGTGGCALSRENDQETVELITRTFPHWFDDAFHAFAACEDRLPVDQHLLVAIVAPRPLLDVEGLQDDWANPPSALRALRAADPVYEFLGTPWSGDGVDHGPTDDGVDHGPTGDVVDPGLAGDGVVEAPDEITPETAGTLLQYRRDTGHVLNEGYWAAILDFADVQFRRLE